ncbi:hypothetical protein Cgig2_033550 [Carnegiea gigantea]|uniref:Uncharacterized protein n=1 Tax=Carnegiea gigantea TaxID=171969 RepID=A0A9Q1JU55_9CARY|nr:hypothetical protein Cgig2_033550 [Carnegiea gigantea]
MIKRSECSFINKKSTTLYNQNRNKKQNKHKQNKTKEGEEKARGGGYTSGSPPSSYSSSSEAPASASRVILKLIGQGQRDLIEVPEGVGAALLVALLLSLDRISRSLLQLTLQPFLLGFTGVQICLQSFAATLIPRDEPLQLPALRNDPHPSSKDLDRGYFFLGHLGGIRSPRSCQVPGLNYVLDKRELGDRLAEGRGVSGEGPLAAWVAAPVAWEGVRCSCLAGVYSPDDRLPDRCRADRSALASPTCDRASTMASPCCSSVHYLFRTGRLTAGFFSQGMRQGACKKKA